MCRICWATIAEGDFETSTAMTEATGKFQNVDSTRAYVGIFNTSYSKLIFSQINI